MATSEILSWTDCPLLFRFFNTIRYIGAKRNGQSNPMKTMQSKTKTASKSCWKIIFPKFVFCAISFSLCLVAKKGQLFQLCMHAKQLTTLTILTLQYIELSAVSSATLWAACNGMCYMFWSFIAGYIAKWHFFFASFSNVYITQHSA